MSTSKLKTILLVMVTFLGFSQVYGQEAFDKKVFFSNLNGFSGEVTLSFKLGYYFEPYYVVNQKKVVITGYENGKYNNILNKAGINFPYKLEKAGDFKFTGEIRVQKGGTMTADYYIEKVPITFSTSYNIGTGQIFPEFTKKTLDFLKNEGSEKSLVGKEMSGGEAAWYAYGKLDKIKITEAYFSDYRNTVEKAIKDFENSEKEKKEKQKNQQTKQKTDDDFWSGKKEEKKSTASTTKKDDFWSGNEQANKQQAKANNDFWSSSTEKKTTDKKEDFWTSANNPASKQNSNNFKIQRDGNYYWVEDNNGNILINKTNYTIFSYKDGLAFVKTEVGSENDDDLDATIYLYESFYINSNGEKVPPVRKTYSIYTNHAYLTTYRSSSSFSSYQEYEKYKEEAERNTKRREQERKNARERIHSKYKALGYEKE